MDMMMMTVRILVLNVFLFCTLCNSCSDSSPFRCPCLFDFHIKGHERLVSLVRTTRFLLFPVVSLRSRSVKNVLLVPFCVPRPVAAALRGSAGLSFARHVFLGLKLFVPFSVSSVFAGTVCGGRTEPSDPPVWLVSGTTLNLMI